MAKRFLMKTSVADVIVELNESSTADAVWLALPFETFVNVWGEEIYFEIPVDMRLENGQKVMEVGDVAYWPEGKALCFFFGPTPVSKGPEPVAIGPVTPIGKVVENLEGLKLVGDRMRASLDRV
ncbi:MAG: hypothetical protein LUO79_03615 [Methanomassiliicoccales archaeon]|nr:hypothetical protein [Methanomassiliicoccales archaeon]